MLSFLCVTAFSRTLKGVVVDEKQQSIIGASVLWMNTSVGALSDLNGEFQIDIPEESNKLVIQYTGYQSDTIEVVDFEQPLNIVMKSGVQLDELQIVERATALVSNRNSIDIAQTITGDELCKAACCNLSESFETNPSVDVSYSDAATGAKQIKMLGLSGTYVQMLSENVPSFRGIAAPYGLGYVPGPFMESIQISKGASSVLNGFESVTGQINVEYLKPSRSDYISVNGFASDAGKLEGNIMAAVPINKKLSTGVLAHIEDEQAEMDDNDDGFMDLPMVKQQNIMNKWQYLTHHYKLNAMVRALNESREGGQMSDISNPYKISVDNQRYEFYVKNGFVFHDKHESSIGWIVSGSLHENNSEYGLKTYEAKQTNLYSTLIFLTEPWEKQKFSAGASFNYDKFDEYVNDLPYLAEEYTPGVFAEYTLNQNDKFIAQAGIRADYSSEYGAFVTPRLHMKYTPFKAVSLRGNVGKGYRSPRVLAENSFYLASSRSLLIADDLKQEEAWNYGVSATFYVPIRSKDLSIQTEWFYTDFTHQAIVDLDSDPHAVLVNNLDGISYAQSAQIEVSYELLRGWTLTAAHRITDTRATINGELREKPLSNRFKSLITTSYQTKLKKWQFDFTTQINGGGRLPDPDAANPLWDKEFDPYTLLNAQITKYFRTWSIYIGAENITDFTQKYPIIDAENPFGTNFDASMVWGPIHGRKIYAGFRWALSRD